ncbi:hypothetical protein D3C84_531030 [compost metagenome]
MGQDLLGAKAPLVAGRLEGADAGLGEWRRLPLALVLGEQGEGVGPDSLGAGYGVLHPAGRTDVGSDKFHLISSARLLGAPASRGVATLDGAPLCPSPPLAPNRDCRWWQWKRRPQAHPWPCSPSATKVLPVVAFNPVAAVSLRGIEGSVCPLEY